MRPPAGFDVIQAEKFSPAEIAALVARMSLMASVRSAPPVVIAAGGIHAGNVEAYAKAGAGIVVTSSPYLARPRDVQVRIGPCPEGIRSFRPAVATSSEPAKKRN